MKTLLTGGAGYIGSHTALALVQSGHDIVIVDNFSNSSHLVIDRLEEICETTIKYYQVDIVYFHPKLILLFYGMMDQDFKN